MPQFRTQRLSRQPQRLCSRAVLVQKRSASEKFDGASVTNAVLAAPVPSRSTHRHITIVQCLFELPCKAFEPRRSSTNTNPKQPRLQSSSHAAQIYTTSHQKAVGIFYPLQTLYIAFNDWLHITRFSRAPHFHYAFLCFDNLIVDTCAPCRHQSRTRKSWLSEVLWCPRMQTVRR